MHIAKVDWYKEACKSFDTLERLQWAIQHSLIGRTVPYTDLAVDRLKARCLELGLDEDDVQDLVVCLGGALRAILDAGLVYRIPVEPGLLDDDLRSLGLE